MLPSCSFSKKKQGNESSSRNNIINEKYSKEKKVEWRRWKEAFLDLLYPGKDLCYLCWHEVPGQKKRGVCEACAARILKESRKLRACPHCSYFTKAAVCPNCGDWDDSLERVVSVVPYYDKYREMIQNLKYGERKELAAPLGYLMARKIQLTAPGMRFHYIIPVPLHPYKGLERGYNQSKLLAKQVAEELKVPLNNEVLKRIGYEETQTKLGRNKRRRNIEGAFKLDEKNLLEGKRILLIDDIVTTGATLQECARTLKRGGAGEIWGLTWASGFSEI